MKKSVEQMKILVQIKKFVVYKSKSLVYIYTDLKKNGVWKNLLVF